MQKLKNEKKVIEIVQEVVQDIVCIFKEREDGFYIAIDIAI